MTVPIMHGDPTAREAVRRGVRGKRLQTVNCRTFERIEKLLRERLVNAVVVNLRDAPLDSVLSLRVRFPGTPLFGFSAFRPDDGRALVECLEAGVYILVAGVDEAVAGEMVATRSADSARRAALDEAPHLLRMSEPLQLQVWEEILSRLGTVIRTTTLAEAMGLSREHLSREFAAGDAPNLKRVIDLARLACVAQMLANPGYNVEQVARIMGYSSPSHLAGSSARIAGVRPSDLAAIGPRGVLHRFRSGRTRSRL